MMDSALTDQPRAGDDAPTEPVLAEEGGVGPEREESIKQTIVVVIVALIVAFIFRAFVVEPFVIPTGSMAPTLLGAHTRQHSNASGLNWTINTWDSAPPRVIDPVTGIPVGAPDRSVHPGDRILVLKYIFAILEPQRWDVVVFKNPEGVGENFIKRLVGLPDEQIQLVDGDVFTRPVDAAGEPDGDWSIRRKPRRVQDAVWHTIFSSEYAPAPGVVPGWTGPWVGVGWERTGADYHYEGDGLAGLVWDASARDSDGERAWPIDDWTPYNFESEEGGRRSRFPIADLRMRAAVLSRTPDLIATAEIEALHHQFRARIDEAGRAVLQMRPAESVDGADAAWRTLAEETIDPIVEGAVTTLAFVHVDQALELWRDGERVLRAEYDWTPEQRYAFATESRSEVPGWSEVSDTESYTRSDVRWLFESADGPLDLTLFRVGLDRDLFYQPGSAGYLTPTRAAESPFTLHDGQFFVVGDNSAASRDSRLWEDVDPWLARAVGPPVGVVPREMMIGKAFFVYFPAPHADLRGIPTPDIGRMRFIR